MRGCTPPPPEMTCGFLIQLVFCKKKTIWFIGVEVEQETSAPHPKKNPGSAPEELKINCMVIKTKIINVKDLFVIIYGCKSISSTNILEGLNIAFSDVHVICDYTSEVKTPL